MGAVYAAEARQAAARFSFDQNVVQSSFNIIEDNVSFEIAGRIAKPPVPCGWFEWSFEGKRLGLWWQSLDAGFMSVCFFVCFACGEDPILLAALPHYQFGTTGLKISFSDLVDAAFDSKEDLIEVISSNYLRFFMAACALLNLHRAVEIKGYEPPAKLRKARLRRGRLPLLSFNRVSLKLPKPERSRGPSRVGNDSHGIRLHQVIGHLRLLTAGRVEPVFVWVEAHWRGNAGNGIVLRSRDIEARA